MLSENHNHINWKNKLDNMEESLLNKNASWEKLDSRLRKKSRRKKAVLYWAAAACLLPLVIISVMMIRNEDNHPVSVIVPDKSVVNPSLKEQEQDKKDTLATIAIASPEKKIKPIRKSEIRENKVMANHNEKPLITGTPDMVLENKITAIAPVVDSVAETSIAKTSVKKKLRVVHINELGEPVEISPDLARNSILHSFHLQLASEEVSDNTITSPHSKGFTIIKGKSSPN